MKSITIYSTKTCTFCHAEKKYLTSNGISYNEILVDEDPTQISILLEISGSLSVPFTHITDGNGNEEKILGFDKHRLNTILAIS
jgi:glutaredoxin 3